MDDSDRLGRQMIDTMLEWVVNDLLKQAGAADQAVRVPVEGPKVEVSDVFDA